MDKLWSNLLSSQTEKNVFKNLSDFINENQSNFQIEGSLEVKNHICTFLFEHIAPATPDDTKWSLKTQSIALTTLRLVARGKTGDVTNVLCSDNGLNILCALADVGVENRQSKFREEITDDDIIKVIVEAVKCLCNIFLNNKHLISKSSELGIVRGLSERLSLHYENLLPYEVVYFDLRLLFLITACDSNERTIFREKCNGLLTMTNVIDKTLFTTPPEATPTSLSTNSSTDCVSGFPLRASVVTLSHTLTEMDINVLCETLKTIYNQTVHWNDRDQIPDDILQIMTRLGYLIRLLLVSVPAQLNPQTLLLISHVVEVLVNFPKSSVVSLLLPPDVEVNPYLCKMYPKLYPCKAEKTQIVEGGVASGVGVVYTLTIDRLFEGHNMAAILALVNVLHIRLTGEKSGHTVATLMTALRQICCGHRIVRRFLRAEILPPLGAVTKRPDEGESLKSKIVRLMTAASTYGAEEVTSEFLFVLCKENISRFVKYVGYGRAAGLLMAHGLLGGGPSPGESQYSSDEGTSDTEEYQQSKLKVDPITGGPVTKEDSSPLDNMTDDEKEEEARKLADLIRRLNEKGIIQMMPLGSNNQPMEFPPDDDNDKGDEHDVDVD